MRPQIPLVLLLWATAALGGPAEEYIDAQLRVVKGLEGQVPEITRIAEEAAERLGSGGQLYLAGERGMVSELYGRAGGLCGAKVFRKAKTALSKGDVVVLSSYGRGPGGGWVPTGKSKALRVLVASRWLLAFRGILPRHIRTLPVLLIPRHGCLLKLPNGKLVIPLSAPAIAIAQWTFVAELIGACRRRGKQLAVYLSIHLDDGRKRYRRTRGLLFEPDLKPEPVPKGQYAKAFLGHARAALAAIRREEIGKIRQAAAWIREARAAGRNVYRHFHGHLPPHEAGLPGDPGCFTHTVRHPLGEKGAAWMRQHLRKGDVYLLVGYQQNEDAMAAAANALGARTILLTSLAPGPEQASHPLHLYINPHWPLTDACLELPGYDVRACPLSGILGLTCYYAIAAEAVGGPH